MLSFSSAPWLLALLGVPLVWWLHRFREQGQVFPVAALFLWAGAELPGVGGRLAARAQSIWLLRGAMVCLLALALAGPRWGTGDARVLTVWIDDSPSMYSTDGLGASRLRRGLVDLQDQLAAAAYASITLRSLGVPGRSLALAADDATMRQKQLSGWNPEPGGEPSPPAPVQMQPDSEHWLLSDGASPGLARWVAGAPLGRLVMVAGASDNVGLSRLVVRRSGGPGEPARLLVAVMNGGPDTAQRTLEIHAGGERLFSAGFSLAPGEEVQRLLALETYPRAGLQARLSPADDLPLDDVMEIPLADLQPLVVNLSGNCDRHVRAALAAYPALVAGGDGEGAGLRVQCGTEPGFGMRPTLRLAGGAGATVAQGDVLWHPAAGPLQSLSLAGASLRLAAGARGPGVDLLTAGTATLISHDPVRRLVDVRLDLADPGLVSLPEYPLLVSGLVDLVLGRAASAGIVAAEPAAVSAAIAPRVLVLGSAAAIGQTAARWHELSGDLVAGALLLLCLDLLLILWRRVRQARHLEVWRGQHEP